MSRWLATAGAEKHAVSAEEKKRASWRRRVATDVQRLQLAISMARARMRNTMKEEPVDEVAVDEPPHDEERLAKLGERIRSGKLVSFPTETVYGLGANGLKRFADVDLVVPIVLVAEVEREQLVRELRAGNVDDPRVLQLRMLPGTTTRGRIWTSVAAEARQEAAQDWPLEGTRVGEWCTRQLAKLQKTPVEHSVFWASHIAAVSPDSAEADWSPRLGPRQRRCARRGVFEGPACTDSWPPWIPQQCI